MGSEMCIRDSRDSGSGSHYSLDTVLEVLDDLSERNVSLIDYREEVKKALLKKVVPEVEGARCVLVPPSPKESVSVSRGGYKKIPANTPLSFKPDSHKRGKAATRYELYKGATTVGEYKQLNNTTAQEQQKDLEHAITHALVTIDVSGLSSDDDVASLSWINKCIEKSTTTKKKSPKKTRVLSEEDNFDKLADECQENM